MTDFVYFGGQKYPGNCCYDHVNRHTVNIYGFTALVLRPYNAWPVRHRGGGIFRSVKTKQHYAYANNKNQCYKGY
jgi:hypothetical protein